MGGWDPYPGIREVLSVASGVVGAVSRSPRVHCVLADWL